MSELRDAIGIKFPNKKDDSSSIQEKRVRQILNFDYAGMRDKFSNLANTSLKFFIANQSIGDYHDNMDNDTFFKVKIFFLSYLIFFSLFTFFIFSLSLCKSNKLFLKLI